MSTAASLARQDRFVRIKPNQILCTFIGCGKAASFVLHRFVGTARPARLAYCKDHALQVAADLYLHIPDEDA